MRFFAPALLAILAASAAGAPDAAERFHVDVRAIRDVRVPAEVPGRVLKRPGNEHAAVKRGDVVVTLDSVFVRAAARAARASARRAKARHDFAQIERKRVVGLHESKSVGAAEVDKADVAAREAEAQMHSAEANATEFETRLERAQVRAPFSGKLVRVYPQAGEYMRVGETAFRIIDDSSLKIVLYVPARALGRVKADTVLRVEPDPELASLKLPTLQARVFAVAPAAEGKARTFRIEAHAQDKSGRWRPGMTGLVSLAR